MEGWEVSTGVVLAIDDVFLLFTWRGGGGASWPWKVLFRFLFTEEGGEGSLRPNGS